MCVYIYIYLRINMYMITAITIIIIIVIKELLLSLDAQSRQRVDKTAKNQDPDLKQMYTKTIQTIDIT